MAILCQLSLKSKAARKDFILIFKKLLKQAKNGMNQDP